MTDSKHYLLEGSDESTLTDLSSDTSPESHHRYSSASLYGHPDSVAKKVLNSTQNKMEGPPLSLAPVEEPTSVDKESLRKNAVRISLTRRRPVRKEMERKELETLLTAAHYDLDKLIQYTLIVVEENNSLKEVLKDAVIFSEDGNLGGDYSEILISKDRELPILNSLSHQHFSSPSTRPLLASSHSQPQNPNEATVAPQPAASSEHTYQSEQIFNLSMDSSSLKSKPTPVFSRSLNEMEEELSTGSERRFKSLLPQATIAENFTHASSNQTNLDTENVTRSPRAELSIRKLQLLTQSCREHGNKHNSTRRKQRSSNKPKRAKSLKTVAANYTRSVSGNSELDESEILMKKPTFFTSDMLGVIMERNELKEKVHMLKEKVEELGEELAYAQMKLNDELHGETEGIQRTNFFRRNTKVKSRTYESELFISDVLVIGYKKKERVFVYVIHTTWSDGQRFEIYRRYGEFFTYDDRLLQLFQMEGSKVNKVLPTLPNIDNVLSLFGRTNNENVIKQRLGTINDYCQILLCELDVTISRNDFVLSFFRAQPGDRQLQKLAKSKTESELSMSIMSVYPQQVPAGSTFEEYVTLADYKPKSEGELSVKAGEVVKVINREATGWWMVSQTPEREDGEERVGYIPGDFLKRYDPAQNVDEDSINNHLGFVSPAALTDSARADVDSALKYVAIEDYTSDDPRQLCFTEGTQVIVIEKSEDGWWLVAAGGRHGWAPASYLEPMDRRIHPEGEDLFVSMRTMDVVSGEKYVTKAAFKGEIEEDISFPKKATIEVIEKSISGWWMVRYKGKVGMAPASMLALTESQLNVPGEYKFAMTVDLGHGLSGIIQPPPRSKRFLLLSQSHHRQRSNTNTDEKEFETLFEEGHIHCSSSSNSDNSDIETMSKHVRKRVITNEKRRRKFKSFLRPESKQSSAMSKQDRRATLPASLMKASWGAKKFDFKGMEVFIGQPFPSPLEAKEGSFPGKPRSLSNDELLMLSLMKRETKGEDAQSDQPEASLHGNKLPLETQAMSNSKTVCDHECRSTNGSTQCEIKEILFKSVQENTPSKIDASALNKDPHTAPPQPLNVPSDTSIESGANTSESV